MKLGFFGYEAWEETVIREKFGSKLELFFYAHALDAAHIPEERDLDIICVFVDSRVDSAVLNAFPHLRHIATRSTGFDHIDLAECAARNVVISSVPSYGENTVAEHAFGLLLALSKRIYDGYDRLREGGNFDPSGLRGFDLSGRTLGVLGTGRIGRHAIQIGKGFNMKIIAHDAFPNAELATQMGFTYMPSLEALLVESDVVTIHVPAMKETTHLINSNNIFKMKKGSVLINTSRGSVVETDALVEALEKGHLRGAGLDVLEGEAELKEELELLASDKIQENEMKLLLDNHALIRMQNVIVTPHSAFNTEEALMRILQTTVENVEGFLSNAPKNVVKLTA